MAQPFEKLGVRRPRAAQAEVLRRRHQAFAEQILPQSIHRDAGQKRRGARVWRCEPVGERQAASAGAGNGDRDGKPPVGIAQGAQKCRLDFGPRPLVVAAPQQERGRRRADIIQGLNLAQREPLFLESRRLLVKASDSSPVSGGQRLVNVRGLHAQHVLEFARQVFLHFVALVRRRRQSCFGIRADRFRDCLELGFAQPVFMRPANVRCFFQAPCYLVVERLIVPFDLLQLRS